MGLISGARSVLETSALDYESMLSMAREETGKLIETQVGDQLVIIAGIPFGQSGSTNNIRVACYR